MHRNVSAALVIAALGLCGCSQSVQSPDQTSGHGKYSGVGIYGPSRQWTKLIANQPVKDPQASRAVDDQVIIVVQNSATGEVRACGDLTGYCIGMNPWKAPLLASQIARVKLTEHRAPDEPDATVELKLPTKKTAKPHDDDEKRTRPQ